MVNIKTLYDCIPTAEQASKDPIAKLLWLASKKMILYQGQRGFSYAELMSGELEISNSEAFIKNAISLGFSIMKEREDFSGFDLIN